MKKTAKLASLMLIAALTLSACAGPQASTTPAPDPKPATDTSTPAAPDATTSGEPIRIGLVEPRSGNLAITGTDNYWGARIAIDMFNERGGVDGRLIEAVEADVPDPQAAQTEINRLIQNEKLTVITGLYGSAIAEVAAGICNRNNVLYWEHVSVVDRLTEQGYDNVFRVHVSGSNYGLKAGAIAADFSEIIGIDLKDLRLGIISENGDFGQSLAKGIRQYAEENGIQVVVDELYDAKTTDTSPIVMKLKDADPDIVIATSYINDGIDITKKCKVLNYAPKVFLGVGSGYGAAAYPEALGADAEGQIDLDPTGAPVLENLSPEMAELTKEFQERFKAENGYDAPVVGYLAWQATWVLLNDVIAQVGDVDDVDALIEAARAVDIPEGTLPTGAGVKFDANGQNERCVIAAMQWQDGKLVTIYPESLAQADMICVPMPSWSERGK